MNHKLEYVEKNPWGGYSGSCSCSDPDYDSGWSGHIDFYGKTLKEVNRSFAEHVAEEGE